MDQTHLSRFIQEQISKEASGECQVDIESLFRDEEALRVFAKQVAKDLIEQHRLDLGDDRDETLSISSLD